MAAQRVYTVQPGDTLWAVAQKHLGAGADWTQLYTLNRATIGGNPDVIHPGEKLNL
jgi:nucleoid-associated protein YgaU